MTKIDLYGKEKVKFHLGSNLAVYGGARRLKWLLVELFDKEEGRKRSCSLTKIATKSKLVARQTFDHKALVD